MDTAWIKVDIRFRDRNTGEIRYAPDQLVEVVMPAPNKVLFQDENGCHRLVDLEHIEAVRTA